MTASHSTVLWLSVTYRGLNFRSLRPYGTGWEDLLTELAFGISVPKETPAKKYPDLAILWGRAATGILKRVSDHVV